MTSYQSEYRSMHDLSSSPILISSCAVRSIDSVPICSIAKMFGHPVCVFFALKGSFLSIPLARKCWWCELRNDVDVNANRRSYCLPSLSCSSISVLILMSVL
jgi:hypothetical protein